MLRKLVVAGIAVAIIGLGLLSSGGLHREAAAEPAANAKADLFHGPVADCQGNGANTGSPDGGFVTAHLKTQGGMLLLNVHVRDGLPNTQYRVHVRCVGQIGEDGALTTNAKGVGNATIKVSSAGLPSTFAIDMHSLPNSADDFLISEPITLP